MHFIQNILFTMKHDIRIRIRQKDACEDTLAIDIVHSFSNCFVGSGIDGPFSWGSNDQSIDIGYLLVPTIGKL